MTRVFGLTVGRNEEHRYLREMLAHCWLFDGHLFFDDGSVDLTPKIARAHGCTVVQRRSDEPSFLEHEGQFRQRAWDTLVETFGLQEGDWVLSIDCDEILVGDGDLRQVHHRLRQITRQAAGYDGIVMPIPEVFDVLPDGTPMVRTDGFWGTIAGPRLFRYRPGGKFSPKAMGSGSEPSYVATGKLWRQEHGLYLLHYGYARAADREAKHARYSALVHGHADRHIQSIVARPTLRRWEGPQPKVTVR